MSKEEQDKRFQSMIDKSMGNLAANIAAVVDDRLSAFKRELVYDHGDTLESNAKKLRTVDLPLIKSEGNKQQFDHETKVLEVLEESITSLDQQKYDKARDALSKGMDLIKFRLKLIRIADKSECGWKTVNEYVTDELGKDSEGSISV